MTKTLPCISCSSIDNATEATTIFSNTALSISVCGTCLPSLKDAGKVSDNNTASMKGDYSWEGASGW